MQIAVEHLLAKIEQELQMANKATTERQLYKSVYAIKTLCDLVLTSNLNEEERPLQAGKIKIHSSHTRANPEIHTQLSIDNKDSGTGDSILDF